MVSKTQKTDAERLADANDIIRNKQNQIKALEKELRARATVNDTAESLRESIFGLSAYTMEPPKWLETAKAKGGHLMEVPLVMASDWHWGETVDPDQVGGQNAFNRRIAKQRVKLLGSTIVSLCFEHAAFANYPGIVLCLGGDMITGGIHAAFPAAPPAAAIFPPAPFEPVCPSRRVARAAHGA